MTSMSLSLTREEAATMMTDFGSIDAERWHLAGAPCQGTARLP
jgi:hypothetical protein